ncbi:MAG: undecaprenyl-diphosphate phosphatase [Nitriliruptorales bacterium]
MLDAILSNPYVQAIILGIVQGLTEFLPVSSSGHLVVMPYLFSWPAPGLTFDVALHAGTLVAVVGFFIGDIWYLLTRSFGYGIVQEGEAARARRTVGLLALGTVPAGVAGITLESTFETAFERPLWTAGFFLVTAVVLWGAERLRARRARMAGIDDVAVQVGRDETTIGWGDAGTIGVAQAFALFPGLSRSGATIAAGMALGLNRTAAARFSFLLMIPAVAGATVVSLPELADTGANGGPYGVPEAAIGALAAALAGYWAIRFLLRLVAREDLTGFARYLVLAAALTGIGYLWIGPISQV